MICNFKTEGHALDCLQEWGKKKKKSWTRSKQTSCCFHWCREEVVSVICEELGGGVFLWVYVCVMSEETRQICLMLEGKQDVLPLVGQVLFLFFFVLLLSFPPLIQS